MGATKPPRDIFPMVFPRQPPYVTNTDHFRSKALLNSITFRQAQWDKPNHDPQFHLNAGKRILEQTTERLRIKREWAKEEHIKLRLQWEDLYEKEAKLKETFQKLSSFIKSNEEKRIRAVQIRKEDCQLTLKRTREIEMIQQRIDLVVEAKKEMDGNIAALRIYEQYLNQMVSACGDFKNADDAIARYEALVSTRNLLGKRQSENLQELEHAIAKTTKMVEVNKFRTLGLNNIVADLNARYNTAFREALHWENIVLAIKRRCYEKYQGLTEVKQQCWNMYIMMCKRKNELPKFTESDFEGQLFFIKKTLQEVRTVTQRAGVIVQGMSTSSSDAKLVPPKKKKGV